MNAVYMQIKDGDERLKFLRFCFLLAGSSFSVAQGFEKILDYLLSTKQNDVLSCTCLKETTTCNVVYVC